MSRFTAEDRVVLRRIADELMPEGEGMPAASAVGGADHLLDAVVNVQADLVALVLRAVRFARTADWATYLATLQRDDPEAFDGITLALAAAYYMSPRVRAALGYTGVERRAYDADAEQEFERLHLLDPVTARGARWRADPRQ